MVEGIPLEIYAFINTVAWGEYENIQADIFDHAYAVIPQFNLRLYQAPSGYDMQNMGQNARGGSRHNIDKDGNEGNEDER